MWGFRGGSAAGRRPFGGAWRAAGFFLPRCVRAAGGWGACRTGPAVGPPAAAPGLDPLALAAWSDAADADRAGRCAPPAVAPAPAGPPSAGRGGSARGKSVDRAWARSACVALRDAALLAVPASPDAAHSISQPGRDAAAQLGGRSAGPPRAVPERPDPPRSEPRTEPADAGPAATTAADRPASGAPSPAGLPASARADPTESGQAGAR